MRINNKIYIKKVEIVLILINFLTFQVMKKHNLK